MVNHTSCGNSVSLCCSAKIQWCFKILLDADITCMKNNIVTFLSQHSGKVSSDISQYIWSLEFKEHPSGMAPGTVFGRSPEQDGCLFRGAVLQKNTDSHPKNTLSETWEMPGLCG